MELKNMIRPSVRSAGLAILLTMNGCGGLSSSSTPSAAQGLNVAQAALDGGSGQIALQVSTGVLQTAPGNLRAMEIKADALTLLGSYDEATAAYLAILAKEPTSSRATLGLGRIKLTKDPAAAEALFQQAVQRDPRDMTALNNLGIARDLQGRHPEAQTAYRQALAINPELDSAQVNLALSMGMSGQGAEAVRMLKAKASLPDAPMKVKHDYAVVLAMAGNRREAERVLSSDLSPDEIHQVLDTVTGTHTPAPRDPDQLASLVARQGDDVVPPDVVQQPETSRVPALMSAARTPTAAANTVSASLAPTPMVVRPHPVADPDTGQGADQSGDPSMGQAVTPVAAAVSHQRSLALPLTGASYAAMTQAPESAAERTNVTASLVTVQTTARGAAGADGTQAALPAAPPAPPVLRPAPFPPAYQPLPQAGHLDVAPARAPAALSQISSANTRRAEVALAEIERADAMRTETARSASGTAGAGMDANAGMTSPMAGTGMAPIIRADVRPADVSVRPIAVRTQVAAADLPRMAEAAQPAVTSAEVRPMNETKAVTKSDVTTETPRAETVRPADHATGAASKPDAVPTNPTGGTDVAADERRHPITSPHAVGAATAQVRNESQGENSPTVQFAATSSQEAANAFWRELVRRFPDILGSREPTVIRFEHDGSVFWRVRAEGFDSMTDARTLCARMRAGGQDCFVPRS